MSDCSLSAGDLVIFNEQYLLRYDSPPPDWLRGVGVVLSLYEASHVCVRVLISGAEHNLPRAWLVRLSAPKTTHRCPIEEEWRMWGDK